MEGTWVYDKQFAPNKVSLASKLPRGQRLKYRNPCFYSKISPIAKRPLSCPGWTITIPIQYLNKNWLIWDFRDRSGLKQPQNFKLLFMCAWANCAEFYLAGSIDFIWGPTFSNCTYSESLQSLQSFSVSHGSVASLYADQTSLQICEILTGAQCRMEFMEILEQL